MLVVGILYTGLSCVFVRRCAVVWATKRLHDRRLYDTSWTFWRQCADRNSESAAREKQVRGLRQGSTDLLAKDTYGSYITVHL